MNNVYKLARKIEYNNSLFQIIIRNDNKIGFFKIERDGSYSYPSAQEFLHLSSVLNVNNKIKF